MKFEKVTGVGTIVDGRIMVVEIGYAYRVGSNFVGSGKMLPRL